MKRLTALILTLALAVSLSIPALAAGDKMTATKTNVQADTVTNYDGYAGLSKVIGRDDPFTIYESALMDPNGSFVFPYAESYGVAYRYIYSEGFITIGYDSRTADYSSDNQYYNLDGSVAIDLPDIREELLAQLKAEDTNPDYDPTLEVRFWVSPFHDGVAVVREEYWKSQERVTPDNSSTSGVTSGIFHTRAYLMDTQGNVLCELPEEYTDTYATADSYFWGVFGEASEGLLPVIVQGLDDEYNEHLNTFGYMDYSGQITLDLMNSGYSGRGSFSNGLAGVVDAETGNVGFINKNGTLALPCQYDSIYIFDDGLSAVKKDGKWGAIDTTGSTVIPFQYHDSFGMYNGYMTVGMNGKYGIVDRNNNVVLPMEYDDISIFDEGVAYAIKDGYVYIIKEAATAYASTQTVSIDGKAVELQAYALKDEKGNPTNYVKLRDVAFVLNGSAAQFNVGWDGNVNILTKTPYEANGSEMSTPFSGDRSYTIPTSSTNIDGKAADLAAIVLTDDQGGAYTYYQLRDLGKALGFNVGWSADQGIFIETDQPYTDAN